MTTGSPTREKLLADARVMEALAESAMCRGDMSAAIKYETTATLAHIAAAELADPTKARAEADELLARIRGIGRDPC
jgi:hypothetical protein